MAVIGFALFLFFSLVTTSTTQLLPKELSCLDCPLTTDRMQCMTYKKVGHDEACTTEVHDLHGMSLITFSYKKKIECLGVSHALFGKRGAHNPYNFPPHTLSCSECCDAQMACNRHLCETPKTSHAPHTTAVVTTTTTLHSSTPATTTPVTTTTLATPLLTSSTTHVPTQSSDVDNFCHSQTGSSLFPCMDLETGTLSCASLKAGGHCRPIPGTEYELAKLRCRKTCGFC